MPVSIVCDGCGHEHRLPDRVFDSGRGTTSCPRCGTRSFSVRRGGIVWHPEHPRRPRRVAWRCVECGRYYQRRADEPAPERCEWCGSTASMRRIEHPDRARDA